MRWLGLLAFCLALPALAAEPMAGGGTDVGASLTRMLLGLLAVVALIFALGWALRRMQHLNARGGHQVIRIVAVQHLGPRDRLVLVQVGGEQLLLGLSAGRITPLHTLSEPVHLPDAEPATPEFAQRLMELVGKDNHKDKP